MGGATAGIAAAAMRARRRVISHFMSNNAVSADKAVSFTPNRRLEERFFDKLRDVGVLVPGTNGGYYIDAPKLDAYQQGRRKVRGLAIASAMLAIAAGVGVGLLGS